jgi:hypothetical protein
MNDVKVGDSINTMCDARAIGGTIHKVNSGKVERLTRSQVIVRNEHGNVQRFSRATGAAIPQVDRLIPMCMTSGEPVPSKTEIANLAHESRMRTHLAKPIAKTSHQDFSDLDGIFEPAAPHQILSRHTKLADAESALAATVKAFEEFNGGYAKEVGHTGPRLVTGNSNEFVASFCDVLGSGEFFAIIEDAEGLAVVGSW